MKALIALSPFIAAVLLYIYTRWKDRRMMIEIRSEADLMALPESKVDIAGVDVEHLVGECVCCGDGGRMHARLHPLFGEGEVILMCRECWGLMEANEQQRMEVEDGE